MAVPILKTGDTLVACIQAALSDRDLIDLRDTLAEQIGRFRIAGVVIDVGALDVLDSFASRTIRGIVSIARLRGAESVVVGIQPEVALSMVQLGLAFDDVATASDLDDGIELLRRRSVLRSKRLGGVRGG